MEVNKTLTNIDENNKYYHFKKRLWAESFLRSTTDETIYNNLDDKAIEAILAVFRNYSEQEYKEWKDSYIEHEKEKSKNWITITYVLIESKTHFDKTVPEDMYEIVKQSILDRGGEILKEREAKEEKIINAIGLTIAEELEKQNLEIKY